jgi:hypothetical protein
MLARDGAVLRHVAHDVFARKQEVELAQALGVAFELVTEEGLHGIPGKRDRDRDREPDAGDAEGKGNFSKVSLAFSANLRFLCVLYIRKSAFIQRTRASERR